MNYSFRKKNKTVKYIVIHYTGMKSLKDAYLKLTNLNSGVSAHYLISKKGIIINLLCPRIKAWHAGKSKWKNHKNINDYSIGIELENKGHEFGYESFSKMQYHALNNLINFLLLNYYLKHNDIIFHSDISPKRKKDPGEKFYMNKLQINRFANISPSKKNYTITELLELYGFNKSYIKRYKNLCIMAVKRTLNYKKISPYVSKKFYFDFYNLLFN